MCGITGIIYKDKQRKCPEETLMNMRDMISHRGPDDKGIFIDGNLGIAHRRLSIIDLNTGHQPMCNNDRSLWIVFNGEIYNYKKLRDDLKRKGCIFKTESDTEVILHLYQEKGADCVKDLNGIFAFALWDKNNYKLFLARDRMGIKPLYYAQTSNVFIFASEIKSLFKSGYIHPECNDAAVSEYFLFKYIAGERTLFKGVNTLLPGHIMVVKDGATQIKQYWSPLSIKPQTNITFDEASEELSHLLQNAVKSQMVSDVPLGTFCSGGVDSSLITAVASQYSDYPLNTFSVGFKESDYDETEYAQLVSNKYKTNHHELKLNNNEFAELLPKIIWQNDEPLNFANSIHIYAISKLAKEYVTVVLTGEGADELFAGYPRYLIPGLVAKLQRLPIISLKLLDICTSICKDHRMEKLRLYSKTSMSNILLYNSAAMSMESVAKAIPNYVAKHYPYREEKITKGDYLCNSPAARLSLLDQQTYLVSILNRQDKMSMAAGIEARVPFLDNKIVDFANSLPIKYKLNKLKTKIILKEVANNYLPNKIINRKKSGFGVPIDRWLRSTEGLGALGSEIINDPKMIEYFNKDFLNVILKEHKLGIQDHSEFLWSAINFTLWRNIYNL